VKKQTLNMWAVVNLKTGETYMDETEPLLFLTRRSAMNCLLDRWWLPDAEVIQRVTVTIEPKE
jgi:hypothetical protein